MCRSEGDRGKHDSRLKALEMCLKQNVELKEELLKITECQCVGIALQYRQ